MCIRDSVDPVHHQSISHRHAWAVAARGGARPHRIHARSRRPRPPRGSRRRSAWPAVARSSRADRGGRGFGSHRRCDLRRRIPVGADLRDAARGNGVADGDRPDDRSRRVRRTRRSGRRLGWLVQRIPTARWRLRSCRARRGTGLGGWCRRCGLGDARGRCDRGDCSRRDDVSSAPRGASSVRMRPVSYTHLTLPTKRIV